mmetsp:Transcript_16604/g.54221  ORF Transcript_16604/g.54221 Transcript_16604/m.54221 type:complete len:222 (+) Transcript_16604:1855-2520(+)
MTQSRVAFARGERERCVPKLGLAVHKRRESLGSFERSRLEQPMRHRHVRPERRRVQRPPRVVVLLRSLPRGACERGQELSHRRIVPAEGGDVERSLARLWPQVRVRTRGDRRRESVRAAVFGRDEERRSALAVARVCVRAERERRLERARARLRRDVDHARRLPSAAVTPRAPHRSLRSPPQYASQHVLLDSKRRCKSGSRCVRERQQMLLLREIYPEQRS